MTFLPMLLEQTFSCLLRPLCRTKLASQYEHLYLLMHTDLF